MKKFLLTTDIKNREILKTRYGLEEIKSSNGVYTFLNTNKLQFSNDIDQSKIKYSDILCI